MPDGDNGMGRGGDATNAQIAAALGTGWGFYADDKVTAGTGQNITASATEFTTISINGVRSTTEENPSGLVDPMYDVLTGKIIPMAHHDMLIFRLDMVAANYSGSSPYLEFKLDAGGGTGSFIDITEPLLKAGDDQQIDRTVLAFVGQDFLDNGGLLQVRYDGTGSVALFNKAIQVFRAFKVP